MVKGGFILMKYLFAEISGRKWKNDNFKELFSTEEFPELQSIKTGRFLGDVFSFKGAAYRAELKAYMLEYGYTVIYCRKIER